MKRKTLSILFLSISLSLFSQTTSVTTPGTIGVSCSEYLNNMNRIWNITIPGNRNLLLDYTVKTEPNYDKVYIYSINDAGTSTLQTTLTGSQTGKIASLYPNGKMQVVFTTDGSVNCNTNPAYTGLTITISKISGVSYAYDAAGNRTGRVITLEGGLKSDTGMGDDDEETVFVEKIDPGMDLALRETEIRIYPNPTKGRFMVEINNAPEDLPGQIYLLSNQGQLLEKKDILPDRTFDFDLSLEAAGVYILTIQLGEAVSTWKIVKQ